MKEDGLQKHNIFAKYTPFQVENPEPKDRLMGKEVVQKGENFLSEICSGRTLV